jgi:hypothetical protein
MEFGAAGTFPGAMNLPVGVCISEDGIDLFKDYLHPGFEAKRLIYVTNQFGPAKVSVYALGTRRESFALQDLADVTVPVSAGVGTSEERLRLAAPTDEETPESDEGESTEPTPPAADTPAPKPSTPPAPPAPSPAPKPEATPATTPPIPAAPPAAPPTETPTPAPR